MYLCGVVFGSFEFVGMVVGLLWLCTVFVCLLC